MLINKKDRILYRRLVRYIFPYKSLIVFSILSSLIVSGTDTTIAYLTKPFVDKLIKENDVFLMKVLPLGVILLYVIKGVSRYIQEYCVKNAGQLAIQDIRNDSFSHLIKLPMRVFTASRTGKLMSRILNDIGNLQSAITDNIITLIREGMTMICLVVYAFITDWRMSLVTIVVVPIAILPAASLGRKIKKYAKRSQAAMGVLTTRVHQSLSGVKVIKAFGAEDFENELFQHENWERYKLIRKSFRYGAATAPLMEILTSFGVAAALWYGFSRVISGEITQGQLFSIMVAAVLMYGPLKKLVRVNNSLQRAMGAAERVFELMDMPIDIYDRDGAVSLNRVAGNVDFSDVSFAYEEEPVLKDFSLSVQPGQIVALVGPSGGGKSTFMGLLNRFYEPQQGVISIDGQDINMVTMASLHANMALVDQETFLFDDTVEYNIRYGNREATDDAVRLAAQLAYADEFIDALPKGYNTIIGDRGARLSGGQRQRICIARAILRDAPILLLDEATSALDTESEAMVQKALANLMENRTTFVIAHRLSTVMHADKIVVLEKGRIVEQGTHAELLEMNGLYQRLHRVQFKDSRDEAQG